MYEMHCCSQALADNHNDNDNDMAFTLSLKATHDLLIIVLGSLFNSGKVCG